jgi:hypothetical protein
MSFFNAQLGKRPAEPETQPAPVDPAPLETPSGTPDGAPRFTVALGKRPAIEARPQQAPAPEPAATVAQSADARLCPLCRSVLAEEHGVWHCTGRCRARWLETLPGQLVDLAVLPYGICRCCEHPQALIRGDHNLICPVSGSAHLLTADGAQLLAQAAPNGLCQCCVPPAPLVWRDGVLVCQAKPAHQYQRVGQHVRPVPISAASAETTLAAIDQALRRNNARVLTNGLFELE